MIDSPLQFETTTELHSTQSRLITRQVLRRFFLLIAAVDLILIFVTLLSDLKVPIPYGVLRLLDLKLEGNVAVWYSSVLLLMISAAAFLISQWPAREWDSKVHRWGWRFAALAFLGLSADETAQIHERLAVHSAAIIGGIPLVTAGFSHSVFAWVVFYAPLMVIFVAGMVIGCRCWFRLHSRSRTLALVAVACWVGVIGAEVVEGLLMQFSMGRSVQGSVEEGLELAGSTLFLIAFIEFLYHQHIERRTSSRARLAVVESE